MEEQFAKLYQELSDGIFRHCYFRIFDRERARELMQDTFVRIWRYMAEGNVIEQPKAFVYRVAHNLTVNEIVRRKETVSLDKLMDKGFDIGIPEHRKTEIMIEAARFLKIADQLDKDTKEIILMRYVDDLSPAEIAETLGLTANVVSVRLNRAVKKLKNISDGK